MSNLSNKAMNSTPKRRGRKRKQDLIPIENDALDIKISPDSTSKRGRKRKQINYYELANPGTFETAINNDLSDTDDNKPVQPSVVVKPARIKVPAKITLNNEKNNELLKTEENSAKVSESNGHSKSTIGQHNLDNNCDSANIDSSKETVLQNNDQDLNKSDNSEQQKKTPAFSGDKKYNYTGETVKMLSNLFKSFTPKKDEETSNNNVANEKTTANANTKKQNKIKNDEKPTNSSSSENAVCAICNQSIEKTLWLHHKQRYHNNLAWRIGDEPLDLSDQSFVMYTLNALYKKKKPLYCDKCGEAKKSVVGFLSHQSTCSKTDAQLDSVKISCELCGKKMLPVSMLTHMKFVHSKKDKHKDEPFKAKNESKSLPSKRSAAKKALKMIETFSKNDSNEESHFSSDFNFESQQFAVDLLNQELEKNLIVECPFKCDFESRELSEIYKHCKGCTKKPAEGFVCKSCLLIASGLKEIIYHVESVHNIVVNPEDEEEECEKDQKHPSFLQTSISKSEKRLCPFAFSWTTKFQNENYSDLLYANFTQNQSDWPILPASSALDYLPKLAESCDVAQLSINGFINPLDKQYEFKKYEIFETKRHEDKKISIFCGGPVVSMAWLPIPAELEGENQILAVSVLQTPDEKYSTTKNSYVRSAIQFWNFGRLGNKSGLDCEPKLVFNLAHNHGPVWHMEWCPSGCYNKDKRMGLLAVTGSDSVVYIYSVPFLENLGIYYKPVPVMKLLLQRCNNGLLGGSEYYPVKISWTKAKRHSFVAVGYTNGQIAIFNLNTKSIFSKYQDQTGVVCLLPEKNFQAHSHSITILQLHHLNEGCRWLLSGSLDRGISLWDLEDHNYPVFNARKNIVTAGLWLTHWLCYIHGADEGSTSLYVSGALKQMREYITDTSVSLTFSPSSILTMSGSDWLNAVMHGNSAGEIIAVFPHQLLYLQSYTKLWKKKRLLFGYTSLIDKTKTLEERLEDDKKAKKLIQGSAGKQTNWSKGSKLSKQSSEILELLCNEPLVYEEAQKRYGLVFCDNKMETYADFPESTTNQLTSYSKFLTITKPNQYPMTAINQILFNPNRQSSLYYAAGYQAGFVRISWMEFLKNDTEIH